MKEKNRIKVCHFSCAHSAEDKRVFYEEAVSLANNGYEVYYVVRGSSFSNKGVSVVGVEDDSRGRLGRFFSFARKIYRKALEINASIYHFHDPELLHYGIKLARKGKIVIFDSHENTVDQILEKDWIPKFARGLLSFLFDKYQKYACKHFDCVISVSPHICEYFEKFHGNVKMITNYPPFHEPNIVERANNVLCYAGNLSQQWNHDKVINAINQIEEARYLLLGRGPQSYIDFLKTLPGWRKVDFKGEVPHDMVPEVISKASIGIALLDYNRNVGGRRGTLGNTKIYEEMMAGLPIICTDFELWSDMVAKYDCGICVNPNSIEEIKAAIIYLINNPDDAKQKGLNGLKAIREEYNWESQEKILFKIYDDLLKEASVNK